MNERQTRKPNTDEVRRLYADLGLERPDETRVRLFGSSPKLVGSNGGKRHAPRPAVTEPSVEKKKRPRGPRVPPLRIYTLAPELQEFILLQVLLPPLLPPRADRWGVVAGTVDITRTYMRDATQTAMDAFMAVLDAAPIHGTALLLAPYFRDLLYRTWLTAPQEGMDGLPDPDMALSPREVRALDLPNAWDARTTGRAKAAAAKEEGVDVGRILARLPPNWYRNFAITRLFNVYHRMSNLATARLWRLFFLTRLIPVYDPEIIARDQDRRDQIPDLKGWEKVLPRTRAQLAVLHPELELFGDDDRWFSKALIMFHAQFGAEHRTRMGHVPALLDIHAHLTQRQLERALPGGTPARVTGTANLMAIVATLLRANGGVALHSFSRLRRGTGTRFTYVQLSADNPLRTLLAMDVVSHMVELYRVPTFAGMPMTGVWPVAFRSQRIFVGSFRSTPDGWGASSLMTMDKPVRLDLRLPALHPDTNLALPLVSRTIGSVLVRYRIQCVNVRVSRGSRISETIQATLQVKGAPPGSKELEESTLYWGRNLRFHIEAFDATSAAVLAERVSDWFRQSKAVHATLELKWDATDETAGWYMRQGRQKPPTW